jgi:hypothetical protein
MSVDAEGRIKNGPSMTVSFGHHTQTRLMDVAMNNASRSARHTKKGIVKQYQDCEFRYACTDCRAYLEIPGIFSASH